MIAPRTIASVIRTAVYGGIAGVFSISDADAVKLVDAVVIGGVLADYITWFFRSIVLLPGNILHGCYDAIVNILFGYFLFHLSSIEPFNDASSMVCAFLTFLLVMALKVGYYGIKFVTESD